MASVVDKLSFAEFQRKYGQSDRSYEYWDGEAIPKAMPTWLHGLLQSILCQLLREAGFKSGSEVELRIDPRYYPKPDVIATRGKVEIPYPTRGVEVAVEILSPEDTMSHTLEKFQRYADWGFEYIYLVDPEKRKVFRWTNRGLEGTDMLVSVPVERIWSELERELA